MKLTIFNFISILLIFAACTKDDMTVKHTAEIDSSYYFTLILKGNSYTTYGIYEKNSNDLAYMKPAISFTSVTDDTGDATWTGRITVYPFEYTSSAPWRSGNCSADIVVSNTGNQIGTYKLVRDPNSKNQFYNIDHKTYLIIDSLDAEIDIMNISRTGVVSGSFQCLIRDKDDPGSTLLPALGTFRLLKQ